MFDWILKSIFWLLALIFIVPFVILMTMILMSQIIQAILS